MAQTVKNLPANAGDVALSVGKTRIRGLCKLPDGKDRVWGKLGQLGRGHDHSNFHCLLTGGSVIIPCYWFGLRPPSPGFYGLLFVVVQLLSPV